MERLIKSSFKAGLIPGLVAPIIWPLVVLLIEGRWPSWPAYPMAILPISLFAILIAAPSCLVLGAPALFVLERLNLNTPTIAGATGAIIALLIYFILSLVNEYPSVSQSWPLAVFFAIIGASCGATASKLSRTNKAPQPTPKIGAAEL